MTAPGPPPTDDATRDPHRLRPFPGSRFVIPFAVVLAATAVTFLVIQHRGRGAGRNNFLNLQYTQGLRDLHKGYDLDAAKNLTPVVESDAHPAAAGFRGEAFLRMKEYDRAASDFALAIEREPGNPANHVGRAVALAALGKRDEAAAEFDAAVALFERGDVPPPGTVRRTGDTLEEARRLRDGFASPVATEEAARSGGR